MNPETKYARCGKLHIAYQVIGSGKQDLVFIPGFVSHLEHQWEEPMQAAFFKRLGSFSRFIRFDKRGHGLSDRPDKMPSIEERMDDLSAVLEAVGSEKATLLTVSEGGPMGIVWSATFPDRTTGLILWNTFPRMIWSPEKEIPDRQAMVEERMAAYKKFWGSGHFVSRFVPTKSDSPAFCDWWARFERLSMSPGACAEAMGVNFTIDVRDVLSNVRVPTLVLRNEGDVLSIEAASRYLADTIPNAKLVNLPGRDHFDWHMESGVTAEVEQFMTGSRSSQTIQSKLVTILMADVVDATSRSVELGDRQWSRLLDQYDEVVEKSLFKFRGKLVDRAGDGMFAVFDGPNRAIRCGTEIRAKVKGLGMQLRTGIHTGQVETRGEQRLAGVAVHLVSRICEAANAGEILVSRTIRDLVVGSGIEFQNRGGFELKGLSGSWDLFSVVGDPV